MTDNRHKLSQPQPRSWKEHVIDTVLFLIGLIYMGWLVIKGFEIALGKAGPDYPK